MVHFNLERQGGAMAGCVDAPGRERFASVSARTGRRRARSQEMNALSLSLSGSRPPLKIDELLSDITPWWYLYEKQLLWSWGKNKLKQSTHFRLTHSCYKASYLRSSFRLQRGVWFCQKTLRFWRCYTPLRELDSGIHFKSDRFEFTTIKTLELALTNDVSLLLKNLKEPKKFLLSKLGRWF